jgi:hypothetical protein
MEKTKKKFMSESNLLITFTFVVSAILLLYLANQFSVISITGFAVASYNDYSIYILNAYEGDNVEFIIPVKNNKGTEISNAYAEVTILDSKNNKLSDLVTESISILPNETKEIKVSWNGGSSGDYQVRTLLFLDEESYSFSKIFKIEKKTLTFESIIVDQFKLGEIVNFSIAIQNHLDERIENVSAGILIMDDSGNIISEVRSIKENLQPLELKKLAVNWDTKGIQAGTYNAKLNVNYGENFLDKDIVLNIGEENIEVTGIGYSIAQQPKESSYTSYIIMFLVALLVLVNISWIVYYRRKVKKNIG